MRTSRIPSPGETVLGGEFFQLPGGKGANQAVAASRLGADVAMIGCVGEDGFGNSLVQGLSDAGVDVKHVKHHSGVASGVALIGVDAFGNNSIIVAPGANAGLATSDIDAARDAIRDADAIIMQREIPGEVVEYTAKVAAEYGVRTILNPAPFHVGECLSDALMRSLCVLLPNEHEAAAILGVEAQSTDTDYAEMARLLFAMGPQAVVITLGEQGCVLADSTGVRHLHSIAVSAVDSTAAGDCFTAALAVGLADGMTLDEAASFATCAAAISVTRVGAQPSLPTRDEVDFSDTDRNAT